MGLKRARQLGGLSLVLVLGHLLEAALDDRGVVQPRNNVLEGHSGSLELGAKVGGSRQQSQGSSLVGSSQRGGHQVQQSGDTQSDLDHGDTHDGVTGQEGLSGQEGLEAVGHEQQSKGGGEGGGCQHSVVELDGHGVLEDVSPPQIGLVDLLGKQRVHELRLGGYDALSHEGEGVVDHSSVQAGDKGSRHGGEEHESAENSGVSLEGLENGVVELGKVRNGSRRVGDPSGLSEHLDSGGEHGPVQNKGGSEMGGQTVGGDSGVGVIGFHELVVETGLDHPPSNGSLETEEHGNDTESASNVGRDSLSGDKVDGGKNKGESDESTPQTVGPFHPENELELGQRDVGVEQLELGRALVLVELLDPVGLAHGGQRSGDGLPLRDGQTRFGETSQAAENNNTEHRHSGGNEPVADPLGRVDGPSSRSTLGGVFIGIGLSRLDHVDVGSLVQSGDCGELAGLVELGGRGSSQSTEHSSSRHGRNLSTQSQGRQSRGLGGDLGGCGFGLQHGEVAVEVEPRSGEEHCGYQTGVTGGVCDVLQRTNLMIFLCCIYFKVFGTTDGPK